MTKSSVGSRLRQRYLNRQLGPLNWGTGALALLEKTALRHNWLSAPTGRLPHFLVIGATKAGTSWLYRNLRAHPDLFLPAVKELHYFDRYYDEPLWFYTRSFRGGEHKVRGEVTPAYSVLPLDRIRFVRLLMPDVRIIFLMRNPIDRTWSNAVDNLTRKTAERPASEVGMDEYRKMIDEQSLLERSNYPQIIDNWSAVFPQDQLLFLFYDKITSDPQGLLTTVFHHIHVASDADWSRFPMAERVNASPHAEMPLEIRQKLEARYCPMIETLYQRFGQPVESWRCGASGR